MHNPQNTPAKQPRTSAGFDVTSLLAELPSAAVQQIIAEHVADWTRLRASLRIKHAVHQGLGLDLAPIEAELERCELALEKLTPMQAAIEAASAAPEREATP